MATVEKNDRISLMKYNSLDGRVNIQIHELLSGTMFDIRDWDVRFLFMVLAKWLLDDGSPHNLHHGFGYKRTSEELERREYSEEQFEVARNAKEEKV